MKSSTTKVLFLLAIGSAVFGLVLAGTLDPPGAPAPTMVTLQQIYDKPCCGLVAVAKTGQISCWDGTGTSISCAGTGQDGEFQKGASVSPRFTDNANGTVKDNLTGLIWLKNGNCLGNQNWSNALSSSNSLASGSCGLTDGSVAGAWRLPNVRELQSLIHYSSSDPSSDFPGFVPGEAWSSTTNVETFSFAWYLQLSDGYSIIAPKSDAKGVWPVRGGQ